MKQPAHLDVVPLTWHRRTDFRELYSGYCVLGEYIVNLTAGGTYAAHAPDIPIGLFATAEEAKSTCQLDYREKIIRTISNVVSDEAVFRQGYMAANEDIGSYAVPDQMAEAWKRYQNDKRKSQENNPGRGVPSRGRPKGAQGAAKGRRAPRA